MSCFFSFERKILQLSLSKSKKELSFFLAILPSFLDPYSFFTNPYPAFQNEYGTDSDPVFKMNTGTDPDPRAYFYQNKRRIK